MKTRTRTAYSALALLLAVLLYPVRPLIAQEPPPVSLSRNEAVPDFPEEITFYLDVDASTPIEQVEIEYRVERRACGVTYSRAPAEIEPGAAVSTSWTMTMRAAGPLPPGTRIWWRWRITLQDGRQERTAEELLTFDDDDHDWQKAGDENMTVAWYSGDEAFGQALLEGGLEGLERLAAQPADVLHEPVQIFVYRDSDDLRSAVIFSPDWTGGRAYPSHNVILMAISPGQVDYGKEVLRHELSHLVVHQLTFNCWGNSVPSWLDEGLATYAAGEQPAYDKLVDEAFQDDGLLTLHMLSGSFPADSEQAHLSYAQSYRVVRYLIQTYGRDKVLELLAELGAGVPIDRALGSVYGFDTDGLEAEWRRAEDAEERPAATGTVTHVPTPEDSGVISTPTPLTVPPSHTAGPTPTPGALLPVLTYSPPPGLEGLQQIVAPSPAGGPGPISAPLSLLLAGVLLLAASLALAYLAWRRRLPWAAAVAVLLLGGLVLGGYLLARRSATTYNQATAAFRRGDWQEAMAGYDRVLSGQPAFLRVAVPLAHANRGAAALNLGQADRAASDLEAALDATPEREAMDLARVYLARAHLARGEPAKAMQLLDAAVAHQPQLALARAARSEAHYQLGDMEAAARDAEAVLQGEWADDATALDASMELSHAVHGATLLVAGDMAGAMAHAEEALANSPAAALAHAVRGGVRLAQGRTDEAYGDAETALLLEPGLPMALAVRAGARLDAGQPVLAAEDAAAAVTAQPSLAWAHALHAAAAWQLGDLRTAAEQAQAALDLEPDEPLALAAQSGVALAEHRLDDALDVAGQALQADPNQGHAMAVRAAVHALQHRPVEAQADAQAALQTQSYLGLAHATLALAALDLNNRQAALDAAERAVALGEAVAAGDAPALAYAARAGARLQHSQIVTGLEDATRAVELDPSLAAGYLWRGAAYLALGRLALAEEDLDRALTLDPESAPTLAHFAGLALKRQDVEAALEQAEAALERDADLASAHVVKALALGEMARFEEAGATLKRALELDPDNPAAYLAQARLADRQGDVEEAQAALDRAVELDPHYAAAYAERAWLRLMQGDVEGSQADASQAVRELPSVENYDTLAAVSHYLGRHEEALRALDQAAELSPESAGPSRWRAYVHWAMHDPGAATARAEAAIDAEPHNADAYLTRAALHALRYDYDGARADCDQALALAPWSAAAYIQRAGLRLKVGDLDGALADADRAVALAPGVAAAYEVRGRVRLQGGDGRAAMADLRRAVELAPGAANLYLSRAMAEASAGSSTRARSDLERAMALLPDHPAVAAEAADVWLALDVPEAAMEACDRALELDPKLAAAYRIRAQAHLRQADFSAAVQDLSRALRLDGSDAEAYALRAQVYLAQDKSDKALADAEQAVGLDAYSAQAHLTLCEVYRWQGEMEPALPACERAVELGPLDPRAYLARGVVVAHLGRLEEGLADMNTAAELDSEWFDTFVQRATVYEELGRIDEAIADLEEAGRLTEDGELKAGLKEAIKLLEATHIAVGGPATFSNDEYGFSLRYPEGWRSLPMSGDLGVVQLYGPRQGMYKPFVIVEVERTTQELVSELASEWERALRWSLNGYERLDEQEVLLGGQPAVLHVAKVNDEAAGEMRYWFCYAIRGREAVVVLLAAHSTQAAGYEPVFQDILGTFAFTE